MRTVCRNVALRAATAAQVRNVAVFTETSAVLQNNAKACSYASNVWVEDSDKFWFDKVTKLTKGQKPTEIVAPKRLEMYNADQLEKMPENLEVAKVPSSAKSGSPYKGSMAQDLAQHAVLKGYTSNWWMSPGYMRMNKLRAKQNEQPRVSMMNVPVKLYNAGQFENPAAIALHGFSGGSKKPYSGDMAMALQADATANGHKTALYFSLKQIQAFDLALKPDAKGFTLPEMVGERTMLHSVDSVQNGAKLLAELNRFDVSEPTHLLSGKPLGAAYLEGAEKVGGSLKSKYWVSRIEVENRGYKLVGAATRVSIHLPTKFTTEVFNVSQLTNQAAAYKIAGKYVA
jgi:hypothetical protein